MLRDRGSFVVGSLVLGLAPFMGCFAADYTVDAGAGGTALASTSGSGIASATSSSGAGSGGAPASTSGSGGCPAGLADCDGNASNGCEAELGTVQYCSGCDDQCEPADKTAKCIGGKCEVTSMCPAGHADCNKMGEDGCEAKLGTSTNCSKCGDACTSPDGSSVCSGGVCKILACPKDFFDCDGIVSNGCEAPFVNDGTCVKCAHHCTGTMTCEAANGKCACTSDAACNGGTPGTCGLGLCVCYDEMGVGCPSFGQRCNSFGACDFVP